MTIMMIGKVSHRPRPGAWTVALATGALTAVLASATPVVAWGPQARAVQSDEAVGHPVARGHARGPANPSGPYASARRDDRSGPYASTRSTDRYANSSMNSGNDNSTSNAPSKPKKDFQDYH